MTQTIEELVAQKADAIGLRYNNIILVDPENKNDDIAAINETMGIDLVNGDIQLETVDTTMPTNAFEAQIAYLICQCMDGQEDVSRKELFCYGDHQTKGITLAIANVFYAYFASKRHIETFGQESFDTYQVQGLEDFVQFTKENIELSKLPVAFRRSETRVMVLNKSFLIYATYQEKVKSRMMSEDPELIPAVIADITEPFPEAFEMINSSGLPWIEKSVLIYFMGLYQKHRVDDVTSYDTGELVLTGKPTATLVESFKEIMENTNYFNPETHTKAKQIASFLDQKYVEIANR
jgi:hypothetical protein